MSAAEVLAAHVLSEDANACSCEGWESFEVWDERIASFAQHQADMLAAAGLLVTDERDREVAAGALRTKAAAYRAYDAEGYLYLSGPDPDRVPWEAVARDLDADADRIARGEA